MATTTIKGASGAPAHATSWKEQGIGRWITTVDHKQIGIMYLFTSLFFLVVGGIEALLIRTQLLYPNNDLLVGMRYNEVFTMHGTTMVFLVIMPLNAAFSNYFIPIMIGARDVAFPRLNAFSYWIYLLGAILLNVSWFIDHVPATAWVGYANISSKDYLPGLGADIWGLSIQILGLGSLVAGINFFVTIMNMRAKGMTLLRMPLFIWTNLVTQVLVILSFPAVTVALALLMFDRTFGTSFYNPGGGGDVILWQHLFWVFGHPEVYILILPAMGIVSEVLPAFSRRSLFGYSVLVYSTCGIGFLGFTVWAHHMLMVGMGNWANAAFSAATMAIAIPTGVKIFNWLFTMWGGSIRFTAPMLYAIGFLLMFTIGGITGVMHASPPVDIQHHDSYFVVGHFHYVLIGGVIMAVMAGIFYWLPKMFGRKMDEKLGIIQFVLLLIGQNMTFMSMLMVGVQGMPRRTFTYTADQGWTMWNQIGTIGAYIQAISFILFFYNLFNSLKNGEKASHDPWDARTLEWMISSPPPAFNFAKDPEVESLDDFWYKKQKLGKNKDKALEILKGDEKVHMPIPSYYPLMSVIGIGILAVGLLVHSAYPETSSNLLIVAFGALMTGVYFWKWAFETLFEDHH